MGRDRKEYKNLHIKFDKMTYEDLKDYVEKFNKKYNKNYSITRFIEVSVYEYLKNHSKEID